MPQLGVEQNASQCWMPPGGWRPWERCALLPWNKRGVFRLGWVIDGRREEPLKDTKRCGQRTAAMTRFEWYRGGW